MVDLGGYGPPLFEDGVSGVGGIVVAITASGTKVVTDWCPPHH